MKILSCIFPGTSVLKGVDQLHLCFPKYGKHIHTTVGSDSMPDIDIHQVILNFTVWNVFLAQFSQLYKKENSAGCWSVFNTFLTLEKSSFFSLRHRAFCRSHNLARHVLTTLYFYWIYGLGCLLFIQVIIFSNWGSDTNLLIFRPNKRFKIFLKN